MGLGSVKSLPLYVRIVELQDEDYKVQKPNFTKAILHFSICILIFALSHCAYYALIPVCQQFVHSAKLLNAIIKDYYLSHDCYEENSKKKKNT